MNKKKISSAYPYCDDKLYRVGLGNKRPSADNDFVAKVTGLFRV